MKSFIYKLFFNNYSYSAFISNDSQGDDYGCSYTENGYMHVPFYIKNPSFYIRKKISDRLLKDKELSQVITIDVSKSEKS